jgi:5'-3' exonuclease
VLTETILVIDFLNFVYRGDIAFSKQAEKTREFTVVYAFFRNLRAIIEQFSPSKVFLALEGKNNFRYALSPDYKSNRIIKRGSMIPRESFDAQRDLIEPLCTLLPLTLIKANGYEADDAISSLAFNLADESLTIVSTDKDFTQLLQKDLPFLRVYNPTKKEFVEAPDYHFITYLSLAGDASDNISGIVSDAEAKRIAQDPDALIDFLSVEENRAHFNANRELIEFARIDDSQIEFTQGSSSYEALKGEFTRMEFSSILEPKYWDKFTRTFDNLTKR